MKTPSAKDKAIAVSTLSKICDADGAQGAAIVSAFAASGCSIFPAFYIRDEGYEDEPTHESYSWCDIWLDATEDYGNEFFWLISQWIMKNPGRIVLCARHTERLYTHDYEFVVMKDFDEIDNSFTTNGDTWDDSINWEVIDISDEVNELREKHYKEEIKKRQKKSA